MMNRRPLADFEHSASGVYARQAEALLGIKQDPGCTESIGGGITRTVLGRCTLYVVPSHWFAQRRSRLVPKGGSQADLARGRKLPKR